MASEVRVIDQSTFETNEARLQEIAALSLGAKSDEELLDLLAERRRLQKENDAFQVKREQEAKEQAAREAERERIRSAIDKLNSSIAPEKGDDELLALVKERRTLEEKLHAVEMQLSEDTKEPLVEAEVPGTPPDEKSSEEAAPRPVPVVSVEDTSKEVVAQEEQAEEVPFQPPQSEPPQVEATVQAKGKKTTKSRDARYGEMKIDNAIGSPEAEEYLRQLRENPEETLTKLEGLSPELKRSKSFMLAVADVDPAYAMHYADPKTLKRDEDFNIHIAGMQNPRNSGNPVAEMLPEMRTSAVVMAAVRQDFRNLRYATPSMSEYEAMLNHAKKQVLEKAKELGQATNIRPLIPKVLREDAEFMDKVEKIVEPSAGKKKG